MTSPKSRKPCPFCCPIVSSGTDLTVWRPCRRAASPAMRRGSTGPEGVRGSPGFRVRFRDEVENQCSRATGQNKQFSSNSISCLTYRSISSERKSHSRWCSAWYSSNEAASCWTLTKSWSKNTTGATLDYGPRSHRAHPSSACLKSSIKSSVFSIPHASRIMLSAMPKRARSSGLYSK